MDRWDKFGWYGVDRDVPIFGPESHTQIFIDEVIGRDVYGVRKLLYPVRQEMKTVVDCGAAFGAFTIFANRAWPKAEIFSYEALHDNFACLLLNCGHIQNIRLHNKTLIGFCDSERWQDWMINSGDYRGFCERLKSRNGCQVSAAGFPERIDFLKLDCEGAEIGILAELREMDRLKDVRHIRGEWHHDARWRIADILRRTHHVSICDAGGRRFGLFRADRK